MLTRNEQSAVEQLVRGTPLVGGQDWLTKTHKELNGAYGWGHIDTQQVITTWGGTVDAIRGLLACGISPEDPLIKKSVAWMIDQQKGDGSFAATREITWPSVEATAWVLIALRQYDELSKNAVPYEVIKKAVEFLESCIQNSRGLGTSDKDPIRIYPTAITLWALHGLSQSETHIADFLKDSYDKESGGWGSYPSSQGSVALTAIVLFILLKTKHLTAEDALCKGAVTYLSHEINQHGTWEIDQESWFSLYQRSTTLSPNVCSHFTPAWGVLSLLEAGVDPFDTRIIRAMSWLLSKQSRNGAWLFSEADPHYHTWCTANALICLSRVRSAITVPIVQAALNSPTLQASGTKGPADFFRRYLTQENLNTFLVILVIFILARPPILAVLNFMITYISGQKDNIISNILSNILWVLLVPVGSFIVSKFRRK